VSETYRRLSDLLVAKFDVPAAQVEPDASLTDLDLDSLAVVELFVVAQEQWRIALDESEAVGTLTVRRVADLIDEALGPDGGAMAS
jgi:acyl carrier protein